MLAIISFSLSLLGTFLVRSGILISVHSFASDPSRGIFILGLLALFTCGALLLLAMKHKKEKPGYQHIRQNKIPIIKLDNNNINIKILVGKVFGKASLVNTYSPVSIFDVQFKQPNELSFSIPSEQIVMVYIIEGKLKFKEIDSLATKGQMIYFDQSAGNIHLHSLSSNGSYLVLAGKPLNEPIARHGPFVANSEGEIKQAILNYQEGKMGQL